MLAAVRRLARALARLEEREGVAADGLVRLSTFALMVVCGLLGTPFGYAGFWTGLVIGGALAFGLPAYGRQLERRATGRSFSPRERTALVSELLEAVSHRLTPQRVADARLILDAGVEPEAMGLVVDDLRAGGAVLDDSELALLRRAARAVGMADDAGIREVLGRP